MYSLDLFVLNSTKKGVLLKSWGTVIGGAVLQNYLSTRLPSSLEDAAATNPELVYALVPTIRGLSEALQSDIRKIFAEGLAVIWRVMIAFCVLGLLTCLLMQEVSMRTALDEAWGLKDQKQDKPETELLGKAGSNVDIEDM